MRQHPARVLGRIALRRVVAPVPPAPVPAADGAAPPREPRALTTLEEELRALCAALGPAAR